MNNLARRLTDFFASRRFFYIVLIFFIVEALWFVFSAAYPMAFDEDFHLGVINIYAQQWSPFLSAHPPGGEQFGAIVRDPSYLFHYLMSFPYRLLGTLTHSEVAQIVGLRLINVGLFAYGLVLFRGIMLRAKASPALTHAALGVFILIPIVPLLAAHINYDNLIMVLLPLMCLSVMSLTDSLRKRRINVAALLGFISVSLYMSVVKYAALPLILAAILFIIVVFVRSFKGSFRLFRSRLRDGFKAIRLPVKVSLLLVAAIGLVLFVQRYGLNLTHYSTPVPDCGQVLNTEQCRAYGPWGRDYLFSQTKDPEFTANPLVFMNDWVRGMWLRTFFNVNGPATDYTNYQPLWIPSRAAIVLLTTGLLAVALCFREVLRGRPYLVLFAAIIVMYVGILWFDEFNMYAMTAQPVAINGRYLLPILPLLAVILGRGISLAFAHLKFSQGKALLAAAALLCFLHGGGVFGFILRSDAGWYWPSPTIERINSGARSILAPITIEGNK